MVGPRVFVTGGAGTVAGWLVRTAPAAIDLHVTEHRTLVPDGVRTRASVHRLDLRRRDEVERRISEIAPDVVVHTAYVQDEPAAIVDATAAVAAAAASVGASMLQLSTDVVFAGDRPPYDESSEPDPV
ncbi:MAG: sugar nucleotide-binding protein, partial [Microthrixaceae bacterium]|nr:sugar nucleotide-binding protein [Microthrixaceae bacterium]